MLAEPSWYAKRCGHNRRGDSGSSLQRHTVGRNDSEPGAEKSNRLLNRGIALSLVQAVATRLVERAECVRVESCDVVLAAEGVVLEDFVGSIERTATNDTESVQ